MRRLKRFILLLLASIPVLSGYTFQGPQLLGQEYNLKAAFLYRFMDYIDWGEGTDRPITIAVLGESGMYAPLNQISKASHRSGSKIVNVRLCKSVNEIGRSQVVFVSRNYKFPIEAVVSRLYERQVLIISEQKGELEKGSHINFLISDNKLKFEVNLKGASGSGIKIGSQLLQHAQVIRR
ncbi:MAG: YfiR family protein [Daejeonella sp.]|uniref:YfiR family protein n=1 Tax=Daejeonella sp. JGW-45 TaxID=3034148 RepID=UPI0023EB8CDE|nr:YfiR family protein [Daejeonella sp. JGW-45]